MNINLKIEGMHCGGCVSAVKKVLSSVPAVSSVHVDLSAGRATVQAAASVDSSHLLAAVEDAGYAARIEG